ncbi:exopolysaccharide biosynthesis polyprenyl glycosylphosphotransferase [Jiella sp. M17.18]|uniref:exopolysaccharide biosynthesis polyprenyl glycosylphosphotransferase n=1 Tax=Jiella sp. M17.18 TaxID=3234247 RepID=UPI0034DF083B
MTNVDLATPGAAVEAALRSDAAASLAKVAASGQRWRRQKVAAALAAADAASAAFAAFLLHAAGGAIGVRAFDQPGPFIAGAAVLLVCLHQLLGFYDGGRTNPVERFRDRVLAACIFATCIAIAVAPRLPLAAAVASGFLLVLAEVTFETIAAAVARRVLVRLGLWREPVILVGTDGDTQALAATLNASPNGGYRAVATFRPSDWVAADHATPPATLTALRRLGGVDCALLISTGDQQEDMRIASLLDVPSVIILKDVGSFQTLWLQPRAIGNAFGIEVRRSLLVESNLRLKRVFDVALALPLALVALPLVAVCAAAILCVDGGNPFYAQTRTGHRGRPFRVWKLRSMYRDAEVRLAQHLAEDPAARAEWERFFKLARDPRILPVVGAFIRRSSLDELPQLFNVLRGDMSLVGPRPFPAYHLAGFDPDFQSLRASVIPGISGLWQITERSDADLAAQKRCDTYYIRNWSIWLDLWILVHTLPAVLAARGAR